MSNYKIISVRWDDSESWAGWKNKDKIEAAYREGQDTAYIDSIGFLIKETKTCYVISTSIAKNTGSACDPLRIPKCSVVNKKFIKIK